MDVSPNRRKDGNNTGVKIVIIETHDIDFIKQLYEKFKNTNEENIKNHVVTRFLEMLGYNAFDFYYEHQLYHRNGRADIAIKINDYTFLYRFRLIFRHNNLSDALEYFFWKLRKVL